MADAEPSRRRLPPRAQGLNESETRLGKLCADTFLSLWSFPGVYRDQGPGGGGGGGKELCDLLVVFENHVIIFSDKTCDFPNTGDLAVDWRRWYDKAVVRSAKQVRGAERWIREHPSRIFLDQQCKFKFPFDLPTAANATFHRVVVAGGAADRCRAEFGGAGTLMVRLGDAEFTIPEPFCLARADDKAGLIHLFDEVALRLVLSSLDTVSDFIGYLEERESVVTTGHSLMAEGEEDILARYLKHTGPSGAHSLVLPKKFDMVLLEGGGWYDLQRNIQWRAKQEADRVSYNWDGLIEKFSHYAANGEATFAEGMGIAEFEKGLRFLAREPRFKRRLLAEGLLGTLDKAKEGQERANRVVFPLDPGDPHYVFLVLHRPATLIVEKYRSARQHMLTALCMAVRARWPEALDVVGIATEPFASAERSEDLVYLDGRDWNDELQKQATESAEELGLLKTLKLRHGSASEYPVGPDGRVPRTKSAIQDIGRNTPCPCRSGKKWKKCCGAANRQA